jgi:hypothetical protein
MTRYSLTITQSYTVTLDGGSDREIVKDIARRILSRFSQVSGVLAGGLKWVADPYDPGLEVEEIEAAPDSPKPAPQIEDKKPPRVDEELDIF